MDTPLRVVLADDHPFYRKGLVDSLLDNGIDVVREVANGEAAIQAVAETAPDLILMDLNMPGISGVEATRQLTERFPRTRVLMLSVSAQEADIADALSAGAVGYVLKESPQQDIIAAIQSAAAGRPGGFPQGSSGAATALPRPDAHRGQRMRARSDTAVDAGYRRGWRASRPPPPAGS